MKDSNFLGGVLVLAVLLGLFLTLGGCATPPRGPCGYGNGWYMGSDGKVRCVEVKP